MRKMACRLLISIVMLAPFVASAQEAPEPIVFKPLLIIKRTTDVVVNGERIRSEMTREDIEAVKRAYLEHLPKLVDRLTSGRVQFKPEAVISKHPLKSLSFMSSHKTFWAGEKDVREDLDAYVHLGKYDSFCIYYKTVDANGNRQIPVNNDWGLTPAAHTNHAGMSSVHWKPADKLTLETASTEAFLHEWLHNLEYFYGPRGVRLPKGGLHGAEENGYHSKDRTWKPWYRDFLNAKVKDEDGQRSGLGEKAWSKGTIRASAQRMTEDYYQQRIKRGAVNMLKGIDPLKRWQSKAWIDLKQSPQGKGNQVTLANEVANDQRLIGRFKLKPDRTYLFSARVKATDVEITESGGRYGACLEANGRYSISVTGTTKDWVYVAVEFETDDTGMADLMFRLGGRGSITKGSAAFSQWSLMEIHRR